MCVCVYDFETLVLECYFDLTFELLYFELLFCSVYGMRFF